MLDHLHYISPPAIRALHTAQAASYQCKARATRWALVALAVRRLLLSGVCALLYLSLQEVAQFLDAAHSGPDGLLNAPQRLGRGLQRPQGGAVGSGAATLGDSSGSTFGGRPAPPPLKRTTWGGTPRRMAWTVLHWRGQRRGQEEEA